MTDAGTAPAAELSRVDDLWRQGALRACLDLLATIDTRLRANPNLMSADDRVGVTLRIGAAQLRLGLLDGALAGLYRLLEATDNGYAALQLGNTLRYLGADDEADGHLRRAHHHARQERDGVLAIAALCASGELALDRGDGRAALESFGTALGLSEFGADERPTVAPLSGLARTHARSGNHGKAGGLAARALERAQRHRDRVGEASARYALALSGEPRLFAQAAAAARLAPHLPLWVRVCSAAGDSIDRDARDRAIAAAERMGMPEARGLQANPGTDLR